MSELPAVLLNSLPKSGTHLLCRVFEGLPRYEQVPGVITTQSAAGSEDPESELLVGISTPRGMKRENFIRLLDDLDPGKYLIGHLPFSAPARVILDDNAVRMIVLLRDPRAAVCSFVHFIVRRTNHWLHPHFARLKTTQARLELAIRGMSAAPANDFTLLLPIAESYDLTARWIEWRGAIPVLFEDLVGPRGGGSAASQEAAVNSILDHVGYRLARSDKAILCQSLFSSQHMFFRKGRIDDWKNYFNREAESCFEKYAGTALERYCRLRRRVALEYERYRDAPPLSC